MVSSVYIFARCCAKIVDFCMNDNNKGGIIELQTKNSQSVYAFLGSTDLFDFPIS